MTLEEARGLVAQCWCDARTETKIMDPGLAEVFAEMLAKVDKEASAGVKELARFILEEVPGEPSQIQGACETAIRLLRQCKKRISDLEAELDDAKSRLS